MDIILKTRNRTWLWIFLLLGTVYCVYVLHGILMPFVAGFLVAYLLNPLVNHLERYRLQRGASAAILITAFFLIVGSVVFVTTPFLKQEIVKLAQMTPSYLDRLIEFIQPYANRLQALAKAREFKNLDKTVTGYVGELFSWLLNIAASLFGNTLALANILSLIILTPVISFYFLRDWPRLIQTVDNLLPRDHAPEIRSLFRQINGILGGYFRGQALACLTLAFYYITALSLVGLDFSLAIGLITGIFAFIPYFGYLIGVTAGLGIAFGQYADWLHIWIVAGVFAGGQVLESYFLLPNLVGDRIGLHPLWIIFSLLSGGILFGFTGILFAMPVAAMLGVLIRFMISGYRHSTLYVQEAIPSSSSTTPKS